MKSNWEDYDDPYLKRNFGEPVRYEFLKLNQRKHALKNIHFIQIDISAEQLTEDKTSLRDFRMSRTALVTLFLSICGAILGTCFLTFQYKWSVPIVNSFLLVKFVLR